MDRVAVRSRIADKCTGVGGDRVCRACSAVCVTIYEYISCMSLELAIAKYRDTLDPLNTHGP